MTEPTDAEYPVRVEVYRLLVAYAAQVLTDDPQAPSVYSYTLDAIIADKLLRDTITYLAGIAFGGYITRESGDVKAALATIVRELRTAEDLASLNDDRTTDP